MTNYLPGMLLIPALALSACGEKETEGTVHTVNTTVESMAFDPRDLTIAAGDTVRFVMTNNHNAVEISEETYNNAEGTPLEGGFNVSFGETGEVTFDEAGVHYYLCQPHIGVDMFGTITVE